uniref:Carbohydrate sulfotransferase n=1 Tax=Parastrongyloides trichosuri TaxID=131310 RepID=A0A0N4ZPH8_PARTI
MIRIWSIKNINIIEVVNKTKFFSNNITDDQINGFCKRSDSSCLPPFIDISEEFVRKIVTVPKYKLLNCILPKCMSTITTKIFSYLYKPHSYESFEWNHNGISSTTHKNDYNNVYTFLQNTQTTIEELKKWRMSVFIRDPLERFISAFINKCYIEREYISLGSIYPGKEICYGCKKNLTCFILEQYKRSYMYSKRLIKFTGYEDQHTFPQNWFCNFKQFKNYYDIFKTSSDIEGTKKFNSDMIKILLSSGIESYKIDFVKNNILREFRDKKSINYDVLMRYIVKGIRDDIYNFEELPFLIRKEILSNNLLFKTFISIYYYDYLLFSFPYPFVNKL